MSRVPGCNGDCCRRFFLPFSPTALKRFYQTTCLRSRGAGLVSKEVNESIKWNVDMCLWYPHLVYLGVNEEGNGHDYTCTLLDDASGLCTIYEQRPEACVGYPYGDKCEHCGGGQNPGGSSEREEKRE